MRNLDFQRSSKKNTIFMTAGWLFADLLLVLAVIFLVSSSKVTQNASISSRSMSVTPSPFFTATPHSSPTFSVLPGDNLEVGLDTTPVIFIVNVTPVSFLGDNALESKRLQASLKNYVSDYSDKKAGLVITLGFHSNIGTGMQLAIRGNKELLNLYPDVFKNSVMKPFWFSTDEFNIAGTIKFEIYFLTKVIP
jgi:hypothetical protein